MSRAEEIVALVKHIPSFPKVAMRVMEMMDNPEVRAKELAEVIKYDQAITANILKICNAAYFGLPRQVSSLDEALVVIGHDILKDIIITCSSARFYKGAVGEGYQLGQGDLWKHSVATAIMSRMLALRFADVDTGSAFTTGLLHDIGKRVLSSFVADDFQRIMDRVFEEECTFSEAEQDYLGITHAELGGMILEKWNFSPEMIEAVRQHHDHDVLSKSHLSAVIGLANSLVISIGIGVGADGLANKVQGEALARLGIKEKEMDKMLVDLDTEMDKAEELFHI
ncbi:MAG: HDOD domain-containing protein [Proteobacteria bacterium]|nr:HDOD domain-containing protein [Pseudomonadota bacterium]MBU1715810.1 HDOD domain-containing protein [Pseudomonadota bacterium]